MAYTAIDDPEVYFRIKLYTGNGTDDTGIVFDTTDTTMQPDLVWIKNRNSSNEHNLVNSVVGATKYLHANLDQAETTAANSLQSLDSNGFTVGENANFNTDTNTYVSWCWKESATSGFDIVTYTGTGGTNNVSHSLSAVPHVMIVKRRDDDGQWEVYHHKNTASPETDYLRLSVAQATVDDASRWDDTAPTSSVFTVKDSSQVNGSSATYVAYLFSEKQGFSKFGSYVGNGDADGAYVHLGFRPAWIIVKNNNLAGSKHWGIHDTKRDLSNPSLLQIDADAGDAEFSSTSRAIDFLSNGFKIRSADSDHNTDAATYVYMAFAEAPFVNSNGVPCNAR